MTLTNPYGLGVRYTVERAFPPVDRLWPDETAGPWRLRIDIEMIDGRPEPFAISLRPVREEDPTALRASELRTLRLAEITHSHLDAHRNSLEDRLGSLTEAMQEDPDLANEVPTSMLDEWQGNVENLDAARRKPGRPVEVTDDDYRKVAEIYRQALANGQPVLETIAGQLFISKDTAAKRIRTARDRGYLPPTSRGKARSTNEERT